MCFHLSPSALNPLYFYTAILLYIIPYIFRAFKKALTTGHYPPITQSGKFLACFYKTTIMRYLFYVLCCMAFPFALQAQIPLTIAPSGGNRKASVSERIGLTDVTIHYDRPGVKGREGKIWGGLVHTGFADQGFGSSKAAPWRAGANENTTIEFTRPVKIEGQPLSAGKYGFFIAYGPDECILIFSRNADSWGSYYYNPAEDALRVTVKPVALTESVEWLKYEFNAFAENKAQVALKWEKLSIPFTIETDYVNDQLESFRKELRQEKGFTWESWNMAANWCLQRNVNLEQALAWADSANSSTFGGDRIFATYSVKAALLQKMGKQEEAAQLMQKGLPLASMQEVHNYGRQLLQQKQHAAALEVFKQNLKAHPGQFTTLVGMCRGLSANGDLKQALKFARQALPLAPDAVNKTAVQGMIEKLERKEAVN